MTERMRFWFFVLLTATLLGGCFLVLSNLLYALRVEVDGLKNEALTAEETARQLQESWMLSTAPESLQSLAAERLKLDVPATIETVTVY